MGGRCACSLTILVFITATAIHARKAASGGVILFDDDFDDLDSVLWNTSHLTTGKRWCADGARESFFGDGEWIDVSKLNCHDLQQSDPYGQVEFSGGAMKLSAGTRRTFPYMWAGPPSRQSPFPSSGNFVMTMEVRYTSLEGRGDGIISVYWSSSDPDGESTPDPGDIALSLHADAINMPSILSPAGQKTIDGPLQSHRYELSRVDGNYNVKVDGSRSGGWFGGEDPNTIMIGNPVFIFSEGAPLTRKWTEFEVDYVRVERPQMYLDDDEVKPRLDDIPLGERTLGIDLENMNAGDKIELKVTGQSNSGGHVENKHVGERPNGGFAAKREDAPSNPFTTTIGSGGTERVFFKTQPVSGLVTITAKNKTTGKSVGTINVTVRIPDLKQLPAGGAYIRRGGTNKHTGPGAPSGSTSPDNNHWGTSDLVATVESIANLMPANAKKLIVNDMSLPWGGKFDIDGTWTVNSQRHTTIFGHAHGRAADLNFSTDVQKDDVRDAIEDDGLSWVCTRKQTRANPNCRETVSTFTSMKYFDEGNHFHIMK